MIVLPLFPEPIYVSKLERTLTNKELKTIDEYKKKTTKNLGNKFTTDSYVLEHKTLKNLKKDLTKMVIDYFDKIVCTNNSVTPYITQSWLNYTVTNQFHPSHFHTNSYVSGIFYVSAEKEFDHVKFNKSTQQQIYLSILRPNEFNIMSWVQPVQTGDVLLFPAPLEHEVLPKKGTNTRISLSFNVFVKGTIGSKENLTEVVLK